MNELKKIFGSLTRVKVLSQFLLNPEEEYYIRQLTRMLHEQINSLRRELTNLENMGILKSRAKNRRKFYYLDPFHPFLPELTSIMRKNQEGFKDFVKKLKKVYEPKLVVFSGRFMMQESPSDLLIVGEGSADEVGEFIQQEMEGADISFHVLETEAFLTRYKIGDSFIQEIMGNPSNLIAYNKLKRELSKKIEKPE